MHLISDLDQSLDLSPVRTATFRNVLLAALPGCIIAAVTLSFFVSKAFTIDDIIFLRAAQQTAKTPFSPFAYDMNWDGQVRRFSNYVPNAPLMGYVLIPAVRSAAPEVVGHWLQILLLMGAILATASLALRLGFSRRDASLAAALTATCPAVMGMASTVMPDILAMTLAVIAVERFVAWRQGGGLRIAAAATMAMALAPFARGNLILLFPVCVLFCIPDISRDRLRSDWRRLLPAVALIACSAAIYLSLVLCTRDPASHALIVRSAQLALAPGKIALRTLSLGCFMSLTTFFVAGILVLIIQRAKMWRIAVLICLAVTAAIVAVTGKSGWLVFGSCVVGYLALGWCLAQLWKIRTGPAMALGLWTLLPLSVITFMHMAPKYLLPSVPAYALILVLLISGSSAPISRIWWALPITGLVVGLLILTADYQAANMARTVAEKWIVPAEARGQRTFFMGQWGLQWYGELHHARCFDRAVPVAAGDLIVVDVIGNTLFPDPKDLHGRLLDVISNSKPGGVVLDARRNVGFYSDGFGHLPWLWAPAGTLRYELWEIQ